MVELIAYNETDQVVLEQFIQLDDYYDRSHPVIDSNEFRRRHGIIRVMGTIYDDRGEIDEQFENSYSREGLYSRGKVIEADGTVTED